jgi:hypothetical protein
MHPILRNILAAIAGIVVGSFVNMSLVMLGHKIFPIEGIDPNDMEAMASVMPTLDAKYFVFPFLAHAVGTLVGAALAAWIAASHQMIFALVIGFFFLLGGIAASFLLPAPTWFVVTDLVLAYIPMAWIGGKISSNRPTV